MRLLDPNVPFAPRRLPLFYGWVILGAATFGVVMSIPGQTMGVSVFTDPLIDATGLSRTGLSTAYMAGTITSGLLLPRGGRILDRLGARSTAVLAACGLGVTLVVLSQIDRVAGLLGGGATIAWAALALGFTALRFSGQGMLTMVSRTMLGKWFDRRRGLASAISGVFVAFGFAAAPLLLHGWVEHSGWRGAWLSMAGVVVVLMGGVAWLLFRDNPEECGLTMDGQAAPSEEEEARATRGEAIRSAAFWALTLTLAVQGLTVTGFTFHIESVGAEAGFAEGEAVAIFLPIALVSTTVGAIVGWAADRLPIRTLLFVMLAGELLGYLAATQLSSDVGWWLTVVGFGMAGGCFGPLTSVALPRFFGRTHLGAIAGVMTMALVIASAIGPTIFALSHDLSGGYAVGLYACAVLPLLVGGLNVFARHPRDVPRIGMR